MAVKFFGQFLVEQGIIPRDVLLQAINLQESVNKSVGEIVLDLGFLNAEAVEKVNRAQRTVDMRFGDLAVQMGLLTPDQLQRALARQSETHLYIGEAIVQVGGFTDEDLQRYLAEFKADQAQFATSKVEIPAGVPYADLCEIMADMTYKMFTRVARLTFRPGPCQIVTHLDQVHVMAAMDFTGDLRCRYILTASADVQEEIAKAILNQESVSHEPKEVLDDTVMEFVNVVCGNVVAKSAQQGKSLDIMPPEIIDSTGGIDIPVGYTGLYFPVCLADNGLAAISIIIYP